MFLAGEPWTPAETWMARMLSTTKLRWTRKTSSRFWQFRFGIAVQLQTAELAHVDDAARDRAAFYDQGVMVIRVEEFNEQQAEEALRAIQFAEPWNARRHALGLSVIPGQVMSLNRQHRKVR